MSKSLVSFPIGADGGKVGLSVDNGDLEFKASYPLAKVLEPVKVNFVDKLKALIPGTWDDVLIDAAWADAVKILSEDESA